MRKKITWRMVYTDFQRRYPDLRKAITYWRPYNYATILLYFKDGVKSTYNYDTKDLTTVELLLS